ncbi:Protein of unknown function [Lachnospiraceae bacterium XBB2008]|nr:DUF1292 domain-containing protein [Lachnospiraceae bacterium]SCY50955.1 Protein of unknown function [Lachnospiraceae bacterium XBB2008]
MADKKTISDIDGSEAESMTVTLNLDEGDVECGIVTILECNGREYIALQPLEVTDEYPEGTVWLYRYSENPDDPNEEPELDYISDDAEYERVEEAFDEYLDSVEFDELL